MTDEQKKKLEQKLWDIANTLRGKMNADEFHDYIARPRSVHSLPTDYLAGQISKIATDINANGNKAS